MCPRWLGSVGLLTLGVAVTIATAGPAAADKPSRTWTYLTTGNGHGFQSYDAARNKLTHFLEHPYRYLGPRPGDPKSDGVGRRQLAYDFYFGVRGSGGGGWLNDGVAGEPGYLDETNIIQAPVTLAGISAQTYYYAPFGYEGNAMIALLKAPGATDGFTLFNFHLGDGTPDTPNANGEALRLASDGASIIETGAGGGAMIYVPLSTLLHADCDNVYAKVKGGQTLGDNRTCRGNDIVPSFQAVLGGSPNGWMGVAILFVSDDTQADATVAQFKTWVNGRGPEQLLTDARAEWDAWRKPPLAAVALCTDNEKKLWRQSEAVLRMGQVREPVTATRKNYGMMLASLPPGEWHTGWVRDGMYAVVALTRMGHLAEAKLALQFFLNAQPVSKFSSLVGGQPYRVSVCRYFGNGEEEADYSGQQTPNVEIDGWGLMMWAARQYLDASGDVAWLGTATTPGPTVYEALLHGVAQPLFANTESSGIAKADSSIWEVHDQNKKHFAFTTLAAIRGFCDMAQIAQKVGQGGDATTYRALSKKAHDGFLAAFVDSHGAIAGSLEGLAMNQYYDGAVVETFNWNIFKDPELTSPTARATLSLINQLRVESGGFKRNNDGKSSYDNNEWILIDMRMSDALWRSGREPDSIGVLQPVIDKASANFFLLPELYNAVRADGAVGKYAGSIPMVGYGGGAYIMTLLDRSGLVEPNDCGDGNGNKTSGRAYTCGVDNPPVPDGGTTGGTPNAAQVPYATACLCTIGRRGRPAGPPLVVWVAGLATLGLGLRRRGRGRSPARRLAWPLALFALLIVTPSLAGATPTNPGPSAGRSPDSPSTTPGARPDQSAVSATNDPAVAPPATADTLAATNTAAAEDTVQAREAQPGVGMAVGPVDLRVRGYFRAPLRLAWRSRNDGGAGGDSGYNIHTPWLVDDDYFRSGFQYLRTQESDWSEIYFSAGNKYLTGDVALMGSLYSDWARPLLDRQWGIAQGYLTFKWESLGPRLRFRMHVRAGSFWDRFGWLENYDTYLFGRTHQMGGQVRMEFGFRDVTLWLVQGVGGHQEALDANQGLTLLNYVHVGMDVRRFAQIGFYFLDTQSKDKQQLKELQDASMRVVGLDARISPWVGSLYLGGSMITASQAQYLSPVLEVMHALGGRGLVENYLGTDKSDGVGSVWNLAAEYSFGLQRALRHFRRGPDADAAGKDGKDARGLMRRGELTLKWFGLVAYTQSKQVDPDPSINRDGRLSFKWGAEVLWQPLSFLFASLRYDRVIVDVQDDAAAFRVFTPRIGLTVNWLVGAQIFLQYSHYDYGDRVRLRPGQVALETLPDGDVFKLQAQIAF